MKMSKLILSLVIKFLLVYCVFNWQLSEAFSYYPEGKEFMSRKILRVTAVNYPPVMIMNRNSDGSTSYSGTMLGAMLYIEKALDTTIKYIPLKMSDLIKYGVEQAQIEQIKRGEVDFTPLALSMNHRFYLQADLSVPLMIAPFRIAVPWPATESRLLAPIRPFQPLVWLSLGLTMVILPFVLALFSGFYIRYTDTKYRYHRAGSAIITFNSLLFNWAFLLSHLTNQGYHVQLRLRSRGSKLLVGIWCLICVVLANGYSGTLFSFLTLTKLEQPVNSLEELANSKDITLMMQGDSPLAERFLSATNGTEKLIGDSLRAHPENQFLTGTSPGTIKMLMTETKAFTFVDIMINVVIDATYKANGMKCKLTYAKNAITKYYNPIVWAYTKSGSYSKYLDEQVQTLVEIGLVNSHVRDYTPNVDRCLMENQQPDTRAKALKLVDMTSAFIILGLGLSLAIPVFLLELTYKKFSDCRNYIFNQDSVDSYNP